MDKYILFLFFLCLFPRKIFPWQNIFHAFNLFNFQILAMDVNRADYELGLPIIEKAGVAHKIDFREGPALTVLDELINDVYIRI